MLLKWNQLVSYKDLEIRCLTCDNSMIISVDHFHERIPCSSILDRPFVFLVGKKTIHIVENIILMSQVD